MISFTVARKYARAFLDIGIDAGNYQSLGENLEVMAYLLRENKELRSILFSSAYPVITRKAIARAVSQSLGISGTTVAFIDLLIERERIDHFFEVVKAYEELGDAISNRVRATLVSAGPLDPAIVEAIKKQLASSTGKEVILSVEQDALLLGGVRAKIGNVIYDGSLRTQLLKVKENLYRE